MQYFNTLILSWCNNYQAFNGALSVADMMHSLELLGFRRTGFSIVFHKSRGTLANASQAKPLCKEQGGCTELQGKTGCLKLQMITVYISIAIFII